MRAVELVEIAAEVLPRRWVHHALVLLVLGMAVTGCVAPVTWFVMEKAASLSEDMTPALQELVKDAQRPAPTTAVTP